MTTKKTTNAIPTSDRVSVATGTDVELQQKKPAVTVDTASLFNLPTDSVPESLATVTAFADRSELVPDVDETYVFDPLTTTAILGGFVHNMRTLVQGFHGTGKSTHIEQVCARLNWPCIRINLDSHLSRIDLIGRDAIVVEDGKQITSFKPGLLPWAIEHPVCLLLDEYDAGRPEVMFVIQRILEADGRLTLLDQNKIIKPHPFFRMFATANTVGLGDTVGLYHGTQQINQGQLDRWQILCKLNYLKSEVETEIVMRKMEYSSEAQSTLIRRMVAVANMTRQAFINNDISTVMSPRTVLAWATNNKIFDNPKTAFEFAFLNKCDPTERSIVAEFYQRAFGKVQFTQTLN